MRFPLLCLFAIALLFDTARAAEPFLKKNDVIALVGGEDMVVASEYGYLELLLIRALPDYHLRFRNLAWEGDTVFEQPRDLNFPPLEEALDKIGATVVICQFGKMESLNGLGNIPNFVAAYEKLAERLSGAGKRRIVILSPAGFDISYQSLLPQIWRLYNPDPAVMRAHQTTLDAYVKALQGLTTSKGYRFHDTFIGIVDGCFHRDGVHLDESGQAVAAANLSSDLNPGVDPYSIDLRGAYAPLRQLIVAKNKLWFNYWRVQNWAFLAGDRVSQPSSRDWRDPSKRWFPAEREEFLPLIEAKEKEIDAMAEKLAQK